MNKNTITKQIQDCICFYYNKQISYQIADIIKFTLQNSI